MEQLAKLEEILKKLNGETILCCKNYLATILQANEQKKLFLAVGCIFALDL